MESTLSTVLNQTQNSSTEKQGKNTDTLDSLKKDSKFISPYDFSPYQWRELTWGDFELKHEELSKEEIKKHLKDVYLKNNPNASRGGIDLNNIPHAIAEIYSLANKKTPRLIDIYYVLWRFDERLNGDIAFKEFKQIIKCLSGLKLYWF